MSITFSRLIIGLFFVLNTIILLPAFALAETKCFVAMENGQILQEEGECKSRRAPQCTFNIAISLMGYDSGFLIDETNPKLPFKNGYADRLSVWKQPHTPKLWMKHSCFWYTQIITKHLGIKKFKEYVEKLNYGNMDVSGDAGKNNSLESSWISSSLKISPLEQAEFLDKLIHNNLPVSLHAQEMTQHILFLEELPSGWKLYGKTGGGDISNKNNTEIIGKKGWFVGWITNANRTITFAHYVEEQRDCDDIITVVKDGSKRKLGHILSKSFM